MKTYNIYFKDGNKIVFDNFFAFYATKEAIDPELISRFTTEEEWVDLQKECVEAIERSRVEKG